MKKHNIHGIIYFILMFLLPYLSTYLFKYVESNDAREFLFVSFFAFLSLGFMILSIVNFTKNID